MAQTSIMGGLLVSLLLLSSLHAAHAVAGDSFLGDLGSAPLNEFNLDVYNGTKGGYGTVSFIDNGESISWEVDIFQLPTPPTIIELALATSGLPQLLALTTPESPPSPDGVSFGLIAYDELASAIAASTFPAANLKDGTILVVAKFDKPPNSALLAQVSDGSTITHMVYAPPSPPSSVPPAPDMYAMHPGVDPDVFYAQMDGSQVYILESGITQASNGTASLLIYYWKDGTYTWDLEINGVANPSALELRVFVDLKTQPLVMTVTPNEKWDPDTWTYSGTFTETQVTEGLQAIGHSQLSFHDYTPGIFFQLLDGEPTATQADGSSEAAAEPPAAAPPPPGKKAAAAAGKASPAPAAAAAPKPLALGSLVPDTDPVPGPAVTRPSPRPSPGAARRSAPGAAAAGRRPPVRPPPPAKKAGQGALPLGTLVPDRRRRQLLQLLSGGNETAIVEEDVSTAAGACGALGPARILGFVFDSNSRWKLKPVLKDVSDLPSSVKYIPLLVAGAFLGVSAIILIALHIASVAELP